MVEISNLRMANLTLLCALAWCWAAAGEETKAPSEGEKKIPVAEAQGGVKERQPLFADTFDKDLANWQAEGPHLVEVKEGRLHVKTTEDARKVGEYVWFKQDLPKDFRVEFDFTSASESGFFLLFFCAKGTKGEDILSKELFEDYMPYKSWKPYEDFDKYTSPPDRRTDKRINCYHTSYRRNTAANCNLRKNVGQNLVKSSDIKALLPAGKAAHVELTKEGGHITLKVNGELFMDYTDDGKLNGGVYGAGKYGFRQVYESEGYYDNFKVYDLASSEGKGQK